MAGLKNGECKRSYSDDTGGRDCLVIVKVSLDTKLPNSVELYLGDSLEMGGHLMVQLGWESAWLLLRCKLRWSWSGKQINSEPVKEALHGHCSGLLSQSSSA